MMKKKYDMFRLQPKLGDNYWLKHIYDDEVHMTGWELYNTNFREVTEKSVPIMTSETHTFKELKKYIKKHRTYDIFDYYNIIAWISIALMGMSTLTRIIWDVFDTDFGQGMYFGMFTIWIVITSTYTVILCKNQKSKRLSIRERYDYLFKQREEKYEQMGKNK